MKTPTPSEQPRSDGARRRQLTVTVFVCTLAALAGTVLVSAGVVNVTAGVHVPPWPTLITLGMLTVLLIAGELYPVSIPRGDSEVTTLSVSGPAAITLTLLAPLGWALIAQLVASASNDIRRKVPPLRLTFNAAQYVLTLALVRVTFAALTGTSVFVTSPAGAHPAIGPVLICALVYEVANHGLVTLVMALNGGLRVVRHVLGELRSEWAQSTVMVALTPLTLAAASYSVAVLPFLVVPVIGIALSSATAARRQREALHDHMTGLPNRMFYYSRLGKALAAQDTAGGAKVAVMIADLDHFKAVNDTLGHPGGDALLQGVAANATAAAPEVTFARLGGDEFAVVFPCADSPAHAMAVAERIRVALAVPVPFEGHQIAPNASIGVALYPDHGLDAQILLKHADLALYHAKKQRGRAVLFDPGSHLVDQAPGRGRHP